MPSVLHQALALLFELDSEIVVQLLACAGAEVGAPVLEGPRPTTLSAPELQPDLCFELRQRDGTTWVVVIELQLQPDDDKQWSWPVYEALAAHKARAPALVLVVTVSTAAERWARGLDIVGPSGSRFVPLVVGPSTLPRVAEPTRQRALAILGALAAPRNVDAARAAVEALRDLRKDQQSLYLDLFDAELRAAARTALEDPMIIPGWRPQGPFAKKYWEEGRQEGRHEGRQEGRHEGVHEGRATSVAAVLRARGLAVDAETEARIMAADDATLARWLARAATASSDVEVLEG
jgi:hypothetical protein